MKYWHSTVLILALTISITFAQVTTAPQASDVALTESQALINQGKFQEAIAKLQGIQSSGNPKTNYLLGVAYYRISNYVKAIEFLTAALPNLSKDSQERREAVQMLGMGHYILGHLSEAVPFLEQNLTWAGNSNELIYALGMAAIQTRQEVKGRQAFAKMFGVVSDSPAAHLITAQMMIRVELNEQAETELKQALAKNAMLPNANFLLGVIQIQKSKFDEAILMMQKEIEINPSNSMAFYRLGDTYTRQLKWDEAIPVLQKSIWLNPFFSGPYILLGKSYLKKRELGNAEGMLRRAIQLDPNNKSAHYMLGQLLQQTGRGDDAKREFGIAEKLQGNNDPPEK